MPGIQVVGTATGAGDGLSRVALLAPDVVLVDTTVVGMLGLVRTLTTASPPTRVVALALPERSSEVVACAEAGALGYVTEDASIADLVATVEGVVRGEMRCSPRITATLFRRIAVLAADTRPSTPMSSLTGRELEVLALLRGTFQQADRPTSVHRDRNREEPRPPDPREAWGRPPR